MKDSNANWKRYEEAFLEESRDGLEAMEQGLLALDGADGGAAVDVETVNAIFRAAHSIKGGAGTLGWQGLAGVTHLAETLLDEIRAGKREVDKAAIDALLGSVDTLRALLAARAGGEPVPDAEREATEASLLAVLGSAGRGGESTSAQPGGAGSESKPAGWVIRFKPDPEILKVGHEPVRLFRELSTLGRLTSEVDCAALPTFEAIDPETSYFSWKLTLEGDVGKGEIEEVFAWLTGECELTIEPLVPVAAVDAARAQVGAAAESAEPAAAGGAKAPASENADAAVAAAELPTRPQRSRSGAGNDATSIRVGITKVDALVNMVGELVITQAMLQQLGNRNDPAAAKELQAGLETLARHTRELQESVMRIRMLPIGQAFQRIPRLVRDLGARLGKEVELVTHGESTELDKTVLEQIVDPLIHLVRNAIDHGLEGEAQRRDAGKVAAGKVTLNAYHRGGNVIIEVSDDGRGLDEDRLFEKGKALGLIDADATLTPAISPQVQELIFHPGLSTAKELSDVSGRGVGMDVVRRNIQALGGQIDVRSEKGAGTTFLIRLPLTLAILDGQLVRVGHRILVVPMLSIVESLQLRAEAISKVAGRSEILELRGEPIPVLRLQELMDAEGTDDDPNRREMLVVVDAQDLRVALLVDELLDQQQVVIKSLEKNYGPVDGISAATILGDGTVALILDPAGLLRLERTRGRLRSETQRALLSDVPSLPSIPPEQQGSETCR